MLLVLLANTVLFLKVLESFITPITLALFMSSFESEMEIIYEQQDIKGIFYKSVFFTVGCSADYCAVILQLTYKFILF